MERDKKIIALLVLMMEADCDAESMLMYLFYQRLKRAKLRRRRLARIRSRRRKSKVPPALTYVNVNKTDANEDLSSDNEEDTLDLGVSEITPPEQVEVKTEPPEEVQEFNFDGSHVLMKSEEMIDDGCFIDTETVSDGSHCSSSSQLTMAGAILNTSCDTVPTNTVPTKDEDDNFGELVAASLKSLKHATSREQFKSVIQEVISVITRHDADS